MWGRPVPGGLPMPLVVIALFLPLVLGSGCTYDMSHETLSPHWTHESAEKAAVAAIAIARARGVGPLGGPLPAGAVIDLKRKDLLARARVRLESVGWPIPGTTAALPFMKIARSRWYDGTLDIVSLLPAWGIIADLLVFSPFGYKHHGVFVEVPGSGAPAVGNGYYKSEADWVVLFFDYDDRWLWRTDRMDDVAEAFEFLVREARSAPPQKGR